MEKAKTIAVNITVIGILAILLLWGNTLYRQHVQYGRGEKALAAGDIMAAVAGFESAIHMYTPGSGVVNQAAEKLWAIGEKAEAMGDFPKALITYRTLRSSFYAVRGITNPGAEWITRCDAKIGQDRDGKDRYTTEIVGEKMQMLSGKGEGGGGGRQGGRQAPADDFGGGPSYDEPVFNPDDDIPF